MMMGNKMRGWIWKRGFDDDLENRENILCDCGKRGTRKGMGGGIIGWCGMKKG